MHMQLDLLRIINLEQNEYKSAVLLKMLSTVEIPL
jgi:hypothetical protein